jgi:hypothetical protein
MRSENNWLNCTMHCCAVTIDSDGVVAIPGTADLTKTFDSDTKQILCGDPTIDICVEHSN